MIRFSDSLGPLYSSLASDVLPTVINMLVFISPLILAYILWIIFWPLWVDFVQSKFIYKMKWTLLEIRLPKDIFKSPHAMEVFLTSLQNTADGSRYAQLWKGETRPSYSLELVSIEGKVKFFIRTEDRRKMNLMSALYSQFPGIEVHEAEDYTKGVEYNPKENRLWGAEFIFTKPDPYPIKTYIDYGLDKDPKEEYKVDPLVPFIEFLGSLGPNQQVWLQYIIRGHKGDQKKKGTLFGLTDEWKDKASEELNKILLRNPKTKVSGEPKDKEKKPEMITITQGEKDIVEALERSITKPAFEVGIRAIYIDKKDKFSAPFGIGGILSGLKQFGTEHLNGFKLNGDKWSAQFKGTPWEDPRGVKKEMACKGVLDAYKRRSFFYAPYASKPLILNTEELATVYHFPGQVAATPSLNRVPSKKAEAPSNLPI